MDKRLTQAGIIAVPLQQVGTGLNPKPNFLIIDNIFDVIQAEIPTMGIVTCMNSMYKLVYREILPEGLGRRNEMREIPFEAENQPIPIQIVPALSTHATVAANLPTINAMLSLFQFRGVLSSLTLVIDETKLNQIINDL